MDALTHTMSIQFHLVKVVKFGIDLQDCFEKEAIPCQITNRRGMRHDILAQTQGQVEPDVSPFGPSLFIQVDPWVREISSRLGSSRSDDKHWS